MNRLVEVRTLVACPQLRETRRGTDKSHSSADGVAATSLRGIAVKAGVTPALVNYYFGSCVVAKGTGIIQIGRAHV